MSQIDEEAPNQEPKQEQPLRVMFANPAARVYMLISGAGLSTLVLTLFLTSSPLAAAVVFVTGLMGLLLRATAMPVLTFVAAAYLAFAPIGIPFEFSPFTNIPGSWFRFLDLVTIGSLLVYLVGVYRVYTIAIQGMPFEAHQTYVKKTAKPTVRPRTPISDNELIWMFVRLGLALFLAQMLWIITTNVGFDFGRFPPLEIVEQEDPVKFTKRDYVPPMIDSGKNRWMMTAAILLSLFVVSRVVFGYWRFWLFSRDEARMLLLDTGWSEQRRELNRQEKYRAREVAKLLGLKKQKESGGCLFYFIVVLLVMLFVVFSGCLIAVLRS